MFTQDSRTESFLRQMGVVFRYSDDIKFSELKGNWNTVNLGRPVVMRDDAVIEYASLMEAGSPAPAVIVCDPKPYDVLDGVQRLAAADLEGYSHFAGYIVTSDSGDVVTAIRCLANSRLQGHTEPAEWTKRNAVQLLVIDRGLTAQEVAKMGGWKAADIERLATVIRWGYQVRCIGGPQCLPDGILTLLDRYTTVDNITKTPKPISEFLYAVKQSRLTITDAEPYVRDFFAPVAKSRSALAEYEQRLEDFKADPDIDTRLYGRVSRGLSPDINVRRTLKTALTVIEQVTTDGEQLRNVDEFFRLINKIGKALSKHAKHCTTAIEPRTPADKWQ